MLLIPAIDLKDGKCVRLRQGRMIDATVFSDDPVAMARHWRDEGGRRLHVVDLDGAFAGTPRNQAIVRAIVEAIPDVPVQIGGGIREISVAEAYLDAGVDAVILGTKAVQEPDFLIELARHHPGRVMLGLDARGGHIATHGWDTTSGTLATAFAAQMADLPLAGIVYTDIDRDGMMQGVNVEATLEMALASPHPVIASGGITTLADLQQLCDAFASRPAARLFGIISGRALYEGSLQVGPAQAYLDGVASPSP